MKLLSILFIGLSIQVFAQETPLNSKYPRVMKCEIPTAELFFEVYHDQAGNFGAPLAPTGYLVIWGTVMGKESQKRLVLDVSMKHIGMGSDCILDMRWTQAMVQVPTGLTKFDAQVGCGPLNFSPKGKITQEDTKNGITKTYVSDVSCTLQ